MLRAIHRRHRRHRRPIGATVGLLDHQDRDRRLTHHALGGGGQKEIADLGFAPPAEDEHIGLNAGRDLGDAFVVMSALDPDGPVDAFAFGHGGDLGP
jgi:hypothetical protein